MASALTTKLFGFITACCMTASALSGTAASAATYTAANSCGDNAVWELSGGTLTISGKGAVTTASWADNKSAITSVIIENGITSMPQSAFAGCTALTSVRMSDTVTEIGITFCQGCTALETINLSSSIKSIPASAFYGCTALQAVNLPSGLTDIGAYAFSNCLGLTSIEIPDSVKTIGKSAFYGNNAATLTLGSSLETIGDEAFCFSCFPSVVIPDSVKTIGKNAFGIVCKSVTIKNGYISYSADSPAVYVTLVGTPGGAAETYANSSKCAFQSNNGEVHTHSWSAWQTDTAAACTKDGSESRTCAGCGKIETRIIPAAGHSWSDWEAEKAASCTENGIDSRTCANCGEKETRTGTALGHKWGEWHTDVEGSCTEDGMQSRTCANCGEKEEHVLTAAGHAWSVWKVETAASCAEDGKAYRYCANCNEREYRSMPATDHIWGEWKTEKAVTCTEDGEDVRICANCNATESRTITATGHVWGEWETVQAPTLEKEGIEQHTCSKCRESETAPIPKLVGFTITASCGAGGSISPEGTVLLEAGASLTVSIKPNDGFKIADVTVDGKSVGTAESWNFKALDDNHQIFATFTKVEQQHGENDHIWTDWTPDTPATCTVDGKTVRKCTICGEVQYQTIPATGHKWSAWKTETEPTIYAAGVEKRVCENCGEEETRTIPALTSYQLMINCGDGGNVDPQGIIVLAAGSALTITITPDTGYEIADVLLDGKSLGKLGTYTFEQISANHMLNASFQKTETPAAKICIDVMVDTPVLVLTDETAFDMTQFTVTACFVEDNQIKLVPITADCITTDRPDKLAAGGWQSAMLTFKYQGSDPAILAYCAEQPITAIINFGMRGDGNKNGDIDVLDALLALQAYGRHITQLPTNLNEEQQIILDVNNNGTVLLDDAMAILKFYAMRITQSNPTWSIVLGK